MSMPTSLSAISEPYRASFNITGPDLPGLTLLSQVEAHVRQWIAKSPQAPRLDERVGSWNQGNHRLTIDAGELDADGYWTLQWERPHQSAPDSRMRLDIQLASNGDNVAVCVESYFLEQGSTPGNLPTGPPSLVHELLDRFDCYSGNQLLTLPVDRISQSDVIEFAARILNSDRLLPIVAVSTDWQGKPLVDLDRLKQFLAGIASICTYDTDTANILSQRLTRPLSCYNGAVRVYWPGFTLEDPQGHSIVWMPRQVRETGHHLVRELQRECLLRFPYSPKLVEDIRVRVRRESLAQLQRDADAQIAEQERTIADLENRLSERDDAIGEKVEQEKLLERLRNQLRAYAEEAKTNRELVDVADAQISQQKQTIADLERWLSEKTQENQNLWYRIWQIEGVPANDYQIEQEPEVSISSVRDAVEYADQRLDGIRFLKSAFESADSYPYQYPVKVCDTFKILDGLAHDRSKGTIGSSLEDWFSTRNIDYTHHESKATMDKYGHERCFLDSDKREWKMPAHIKFGVASDQQNHLRIHLIWNDEEQKWLIGHVGRHLNTVSN